MSNFQAANVLPSKYWCSVHIGEGQRSFHFMHHSGLTGAAINAMCHKASNKLKESNNDSSMMGSMMANKMTCLQNGKY
eukprot:7566527-Ditylum_brightwellii.AAC.1